VNRTLRCVGFRVVAAALACAAPATLLANAVAPASRPSSVVAGPPRDQPEYEYPAGWLGEVQANLSEAQYHFVPWKPERATGAEPAEAWSAPNRAHGFRIRVDRAGLHVVSRTEPVPSWELRLGLAGYGRGASRHPADAAVVMEAQDNRVACHRGRIVERYVNRRTGLKQAFELHAPPDVAREEGPVVLALALGGSVSPRIGGDGQSFDFLAPGGAAVVRYADLEVRDALGRRLPSWMEGSVHADGCEIHLVFDDAGAVYPVEVDPLAKAPAWTAEPDQESTAFGFSAETAGDVNGDGYSDVIVGAWFYDNGESGEGRAFVYHGSASGLATAPAWTAESDQPGANFARSVATAGDVNGDGYSDVIIACVYCDNGETDEGRAFVYHGSPTGLSATASWTAEPDQDDARVIHATTAGDVNGDGFSDVIVGAMLYDNGETNEGRAWVYHGSPSGLQATPAWFGESDQENAIFGARLASAGDVNGDGYSDVLVAAYFYDGPDPNEGRAYVFHGSPAGLAAEPAWIGESGQAFGEFGDRLAAGDVNGDGYTDIIVGAHEYDNPEVDEGILYVFHGSATGVETTARWVGEANQQGAFYAGSLGSADINGDGYADLLVGANRYDNGEEDEGRVFLYLGSATGIRPVPVWTAEGNQEGANFGLSVASAGDVNGDGFTDVIVGAPQYDGPEYNEGRVYVYYGSAAGLARDEAWASEGDRAGGTLGFSVRTAGDVNGDGYSDVIVGAPLYDNGESDEGRAFVYHGTGSGLEASPAWAAEGNQLGAQLGSAVGGAGDVNGDGYSDVIVGAPLYDNGQSDEGRALVYHGSASGLAASPSWTVEGDQAGARFGHAVSTAGDVDGDGYSDVIVGAPLYDNGQSDEGRALVYHGSAAGLAADPSWTAEGDQAGAWFGHAVSTAGDVDGDGYSDVIVGAPLYDNGQSDEGRAFAYHGGDEGVEASPAWSVESQQAGASFGRAVATAGDVDGDGYSDVVVGAPLYDNGQTDEGRAYVYHGSAAGLATLGRVVEGQGQAQAGFGEAVAAAGDVNGDGLSDLIVGAPGYDGGEDGEGAAFVYHGTLLGLSPSPAWTVEGARASAALGTSVSGAGDFDGDGFADVVVGAPHHDAGGADAGRVSVHLGNDGGGVDRIARQARVDDEAPIDLLGRSDSETSFRLKARGRSAAGRGNLRLEWEVKALGTPFDGADIVQGPSVDSGEPTLDGSAVELAALVADLPAGPYRWRLRVASDSPYFPHSPWLSPPYNNRAETDLRLACSEAGLAEVEGLVVLDDKETLEWAASASRVVYDVVRGVTGELPVGAGASETCLEAGLAGTSLADDAVPPRGQSYWYLVRGRNACGVGTYGAESGGEERATTACP